MLRVYLSYLLNKEAHGGGWEGPSLGSRRLAHVTTELIRHMSIQIAHPLSTLDRVDVRSSS